MCDKTELKIENLNERQTQAIEKLEDRFATISIAADGIQDLVKELVTGDNCCKINCLVRLLAESASEGVAEVWSLRGV